MKINAVLGTTQFGFVLVGVTPQGLCSVGLGEDLNRLEFELKESFPDALIEGPGGNCTSVLHDVIQAIRNPHHIVNYTLDLYGTDFQQRVWNEIDKIPVGQAATYGEIAERMGEPKAYRAVANACAANKIAVVIPCHRVIPASGGLGEYRWGSDLKKKLLEREGFPGISS